MAYVEPREFSAKLVEAEASRMVRSAQNVYWSAFMARAILAFAALAAVTVTANTGNPLLGALCFPAGLIVLFLMKFDLRTCVFVLMPMTVIDRRTSSDWVQVWRNWAWVLLGNLTVAMMVANFTSFILTFGYNSDS
jgi:formate/nitrite transporter FocA (FNT family)